MFSSLLPCSAGTCLRPKYFEPLMTSNEPLPWIEILADNFIYTEGISRLKLDAIVKNTPVVLHCVGFGLGNMTPIDNAYCQKVAALAKTFNTLCISDHLCWTADQQQHSHSLLPLPYTEPVAKHCARRIKQIQQILPYPFLIENVASYMSCPDNTLDEIDFINYVSELADCGLLLDINNLFVNAHNLKQNPLKWLKRLNKARVGQYHLAGHQQDGELLVDTHDCPVSESVWQLYREALLCIGPRGVCVEWDSQLPSWSTFCMQTKKAQDSLDSLVAVVPC